MTLLRWAMWVVGVAGVLLLVEAGRALFGKDLAAGVGAAASVFTVFATLGLLVLNYFTEQRAKAAEQDNVQLRAIAERQALAMTEQAKATREQVEMLRADQELAQKVRLQLIDVGQDVTMGGGGIARVPGLLLINMSAHGIFVHDPQYKDPAVQFPIDALFHEQRLLVTPGSPSWFLAPGNSVFLDIAYMRQVNNHKKPMPTLLLHVPYLYPGIPDGEVCFEIDFSGAIGFSLHADFRMI
ncbi:hypothetical protein [Deinococcus ruber]|uniref:Uncharacterized protein n=1 Tax=Deinococcus ruber TaxID=1848197 RepID=A0A918F5Q4_9DEIO|nr:hypothetical protein [Deinococcus ruber]GGR11447.1 hypothetical protein GCM10008957_25320 [Deinococcus ruber]